jgi:4-coumarate--CoA ligase
VAEFPRGIDGIADAAVRLGASGRVKPFIVPADVRDHREVNAVVEQIVATRLTGPERLKSLAFGPALPRNPLDKLSDSS